MTEGAELGDGAKPVALQREEAKSRQRLSVHPSRGRQSIVLEVERGDVGEGRPAHLDGHAADERGEPASVQTHLVELGDGPRDGLRLGEFEKVVGEVALSANLILASGSLLGRLATPR